YGPLIGLPTPPIGLNFTNNPRLGKFTQEFRLASEGDGPWQWQAGFYYTREHGGVVQAVDTFNVITQAPIDAVSLFGDSLFFGKVSAKYKEYAGYADVTYNFTPQFQIQVGVRESYNKQSHVFPSEGLLAGGSQTVTGGSSDDSFTYLITPKYTFDENSMVYGRIASGYRPGGPNNGLAALTGLPTTFGPDTLTNYEVGYKASFLDRTATLDLSIFDIEWKDIQILETVAGISQTGNGAKARSYGFEGAASWTPITGLNLFATLALTKAYLSEDAPGVNGKDGDRLPYSPKVGGTISADYQFPLVGELTGFVGATFRYVGDRQPDFQSSAPPGYVRPTLDAYHTFDLRAGVQRDGVEMNFYVKNLNNSG
ncbi:MAG: TonB-dependent receptor, partial [Myxococcota bacterium]